MLDVMLVRSMPAPLSERRRFAISTGLVHVQEPAGTVTVPPLPAALMAAWTAACEQSAAWTSATTSSRAKRAGTEVNATTKASRRKKRRNVTSCVKKNLRLRLRGSTDTQQALCPRGEGFETCSACQVA